MTHHGRHRKVRPRHWFALTTAATLALAVVLLNLWWADDPQTQSRAAGGDQPGDQPGDVAVTASVDRVASPQHSGDMQEAVTVALSACRNQHARQAPVLVSASRSVQQWRTHVEAMNQLVAGEITLEQAAEFWEQTRAGAAERIERFTTADGNYLSSDADCPWVAGARGVGVPDLRECYRDTAAREELLGSSRVALTTWAHHVHDMERLRAGTLSPERATELWQRNWQQGVDQLEDYWAKARTAGETTC
ncbi:MAG TPA: hypothetical protein VFJ14_01250 [Nocardioidaceae bacterium]|nr:hypothetical protein [Nocardioidaceae bacterium]